MSEIAKKLLFVGIDTSNYTTSCALCDGEGRVIANIKKMLPVKDGERGLRQSDALFAHTKNLPECMEALGEVIKKEMYDGARVVAVGYSATPRDIEGSYMPCFLAGVAAAKSFCASIPNVKSYALSHQCGHIRAAIYSSGYDHSDGKPFGAFHVSGGTTDILLCQPCDSSIKIDGVGGSLDINAGQAIDRTGVLMGLPFPAGKHMELLANQYTEPVKGVSVCVNGMSCNLSGLENKAAEAYRKTGDKSYVCAYVFEFVGKTLYKMSEAFKQTYGDIPIIYAGGVMSNRIIKKKLSKINNTYFSEPEFSADNASGIAIMARDKYLLENN